MRVNIYLYVQKLLPPPPPKKNMGSMSNRDIKMQMKQCRKVPKLNF